MCRIAGLAGINDENRDLAFDFMREVRPFMTRSGNNKDGFGYSAITKEGKVYGEKWHKPEDAFNLTPEDIKVIESFGDDAIDGNNRYMKYNSDDLDEDWDETVAVTLHARYSTNTNDFENTHPFFEDNNSIIHNGMIRNHEEFTKKYSTCDSEVILHEYIKNEIAKHPANISNMTKKLIGYYGVMVLTNDGDKKPVMDIFRANGADIYVTYVNELETYVFCTSDTILKDAFKELKWEHENKFFKIKEEKLLRLCAETGELIEKLKFESNVNYNNTYTYKKNPSDDDNFKGNSNFGNKGGGTSNSPFKNGGTNYSSNFNKSNKSDDTKQKPTGNIIFNFDEYNSYVNAKDEDISKFTDIDLYKYYIVAKIANGKMDNDISQLSEDELDYITAI